MPFRLDEQRAKIQFVTSAETPSLVYQAAKRTGKVSNTVYLQHVVAEALSRDLGIPLQDLLDHLPEPKGLALVHLGHDRRPVQTETP